MNVTWERVGKFFLPVPLPLTSNPSLIDLFLILWQQTIHWFIIIIIDIPPGSDRYGDRYILLPDVVFTYYILDCILLLGSMIHDVVSLYCVNGPITYYRSIIWWYCLWHNCLPMNHNFLIIQWSSIYNWVFDSYKLLLNTFIVSVTSWHGAYMQLYSL